MLSFIMLNVVAFYIRWPLYILIIMMSVSQFSDYGEYLAECHHAECHHAECRYAECHYAECHYAECHYAECHYAECHYAECRGVTLKLSIK